MIQRDQIRVQLPDRSYLVHVGEHLFEPAALADALGGGERFPAQPCAIVTNPTVGSLYGPSLATGLKGIGFQPRTVEIPDGEAFKTLETVRSVYDALIDAQIDRHSCVIALGGGVVGDLAGFVAATYLRGVPFVQVPTTLLAMVDASVGGKVAVDHPRGKNLIGAFKQPLAVVADTGTLATLPVDEWRAGMSEVVKHAIIGAPELLELFEGDDWKQKLQIWLTPAIRVKADIIARDPFEHGERAVLNLGHTFGHAFEQVTGFRLRHGDAVAVGIACACRLAAQLGECQPEFASRVERLLQHLGLGTRLRVDCGAAGIVEAMQTDKKRVGARIRFVLPRAPGDIVIRDDIDQRLVLAVVQEAIDS